MERFFALDMPATRFLRNTLAFSLLGLLAALALYVAVTPGLGAMLLAGGPPGARFLRQVLTNGLPVVFVVNYAGFFLYAWVMSRAPSARVRALLLVFDIPGRIAVFAALHAIIYVLSADWFGSFGGSRWTALQVVAPTLARSALFENLSGAYLYATLVSAVPLHATLLRRPGSGRVSTALLALAWFALSAAALTWLADALSGPRSG